MWKDKGKRTWRSITQVKVHARSQSGVRFTWGGKLWLTRDDAGWHRNQLTGYFINGSVTGMQRHNHHAPAILSP